MHPLHEHVAAALATEVKRRGVVVWYDPSAEFVPFIAELRGNRRSDEVTVTVPLGGEQVHLAEYAGSMFELRTAVEPYVCGDSPTPVVLYLPGCRRKMSESPLMELEKAGTTWDPQLHRLARELLLKRHTLGDVDAMLAADRNLDYHDLTRIVADKGSATASILRSIFTYARDDTVLLARWLADESQDSDIVTKAATGELVALVHSSLGLTLPEEAEPAKLRSITIRYVLGNEFRLDLAGEPPASLNSIPAPPTPQAVQAIRGLAALLRADHAPAYPTLADRVAQELNLGTGEVSPAALGLIETFRFEERGLLGHCGDLIARSAFDEALALLSQRQHSFWLNLDSQIERKAHWEAVRLMAELGQATTKMREAVARANGNSGRWVEQYTSIDGWYRLDQVQRQLEAWVTRLDEPLERPLGVVRRAYEDTCQLMAEGFTKALAGSGWSVPGGLHQTRVFSEVVSAQPKPVAYFLVDAMRYEMGVELANRLPATSEVAIRAAIGSLPSITPVGMAALLPGASASFSVVERNGKLGAQIDETFLPDRPARGKFAQSRIPKLQDLELDTLLGMSRSKLRTKVEGAQVVIVRSQEIDHNGEAGFTFAARQAMDTVIDNLVLAVRRLAAAGIGHAVVTADHGHLFFPEDRDESMRTDAPGGETVDLHRRCWIGRGGMKPPASVRVPASALGYASDLDLVFPPGVGVFKAGGDLAFYHGGPSLQELVIPVVVVRSTVETSKQSNGGERVVVAGLPDAITNRIFTVLLLLGDHQLPLLGEGLLVRPILVAKGRQVGAVGMAVGAELDRATECVRLAPGRPVTIAFRLIDEDAETVRVVVQDPATDAELYRSPSDIPVQLGVS
jgi:PglZ domain